MDVAVLRNSLVSCPRVLRATVEGTDDGAARIRPADGGWSTVEVVRHLLHEERRDFRARLRSTLDGGGTWEPIDPEAWTESEGDQSASLAETLVVFARERRDSIVWLDSLDAPDWRASYPHPELGVLTAGDLLASWAAHDALHLAQLARVRAIVLNAAAAPHSIRYATG